MLCSLDFQNHCTNLEMYCEVRCPHFRTLHPPNQLQTESQQADKITGLIVVDSDCGELLDKKHNACLKEDGKYLYVLFKLNLGQIDVSPWDKKAIKIRMRFESEQPFRLDFHGSRPIVSEGSVDTAHVLDLTHAPLVLHPPYPFDVAESHPCDMMQVQLILKRQPFPQWASIIVSARIEGNISLPLVLTRQMKVYIPPKLKAKKRKPPTTKSAGSLRHQTQHTTESERSKEKMSSKKKKYDVFVSYSHKDQDLAERLFTQMAALKRERMNLWYDRMISPGADWEERIAEEINNARIILLLVSPDFIESDYIYLKELTVAMKRYEDGETIVVPIILRHCDWHGQVYKKLQALPDRGTPITDETWQSLDKATMNVVDGLRRLINTLK